jgi:hypothetical protein
VSVSGPEFVVVRVREGELVGAGSWVYVWLDDDGEVVYVGATGLDPQTRVWLHLHDPDREIGRMAARFDRLTTTELDVVAMRVPEEISRADVRDVLGARLADEGLLAGDAITDHLQLVLEPADEVVELAERFVARLRAYLEPRDPALL